MSAMEINFRKSLFVRVNVKSSWLGDVFGVFSCKVGQVPFEYIGLSIGGMPRSLSF